MAPFWTPRCLQDRRFRPPRCLLFGLLFLMPFWIDFWPLLGPILAPTWAQLGAPKRPPRGPEGPRRPLGPQNPPETPSRPPRTTPKTPSRPPSGSFLGLSGVDFGGTFRCVLVCYREIAIPFPGVIPFRAFVLPFWGFPFSGRSIITLFRA